MVAAVALSAGLIATGWFASEVTRNLRSTGTLAPSATNQEATPIVAGDASEPAAEVAKVLSPSVVQIENGDGLGSGVIYTADGLILTNAHVVGSSRTVKVRLSDGSVSTGRVLGTDVSSDVAVVDIDRSGLTPARLAEDPPVVGQMAIALGSPFGLQSTVTAGIVSAVDRPVSGETGVAVNMIQTDAPINPGNSGGALANRRGEVIGINASIFSRSGDNSGIGFAIPIQTAKTIADKIQRGESLAKGYLGVETRPTSTDGRAGAQIARVLVGTPADKAGLEPGDLITAIDGNPVKNPTDLSARIAGHSPGDRVVLEVDRGGQTRTIEVELTAKPGVGG
ncbi:MAG: trypsin-like peptidase domain-containing protein [Acidimicrobiales bacterium]|nr:trypsin-like peptidase domain-containing protein [Acidimicrobiales bacterium]